jgi:hypothetical protein
MLDFRHTLLPSRACLMTVRDTLCATRRLGLQDVVHEAKAAARRKNDLDTAAVAALALLWETVACLELAANVAAPWVDPQLDSPNGAWVEMTRYDGGRANRFYESSQKWTDERFAVLSAHRFRHGDNTTMLDAMREFGIADERILAALKEAAQATIRLLRDHFETLAAAWSQMRAYAAAYEHGLLFVPAAVGDIVDEKERVIPHAIITWDTRRPASRGQHGATIDSIIEYGSHAGTLSIDVAFHVADARLRIIEAIEFDGDDVYLVPWKDPIPYWVRRGDVSDETLAVLQNLTIGWIQEDDDEVAKGSEL